VSEEIVKHLLWDRSPRHSCDDLMRLDAKISECLSSGLTNAQISRRLCDYLDRNPIKSRLELAIDAIPEGWSLLSLSCIDREMSIWQCQLSGDKGGIITSNHIYSAVRAIESACEILNRKLKEY